MTEKERYEVLLGELAEMIKMKNETISLQNWKIEDLCAKLKEAESYLPKGGKTALKLEIRSKEKNEI